MAAIPSSHPNHDQSPGDRTGARLHCVDAGDAGRLAVEAFIRDVYRARYGATVPAFAPTLVALRDASGAIVAAAGYRGAADGPLFLERYLDAPVERLLCPAGAAPLPRRRIVEVGHLAASRAGEGRRLILALGPHLAARRFQWVASTLTQELRHLFVRLGITPLALAPARPETLGDAARDWGRYYDHAPVVLAGRLDSALRVLAQRGLVRPGVAE